jgi:hypothetical protein
MLSSPTCPEDADLLALAMGEPVPAEVTAHVAECASCQSRHEQLKADVALFRANRQEASFSPLISISPSTLSEPMSHPAATNGQVDQAEGTTRWNLRAWRPSLSRVPGLEANAERAFRLAHADRSQYACGSWT